MNIANIILVFAIAWWLSFFMLLPVGVRSQHETDDVQVAGTDPSAPVNPALGKKALGATVIAAVLTGLCMWVVETGILADQFDLPY